MRTLLERTYKAPDGSKRVALVTAPNSFQVRLFVSGEKGETVMDTLIPAHTWYRHRQMYVDQFSGR